MARASLSFNKKWYIKHFLFSEKSGYNPSSRRRLWFHTFLEELKHTLNYNGPLCMMQREDWHALNTTGTINQLVQIPVRYVIISHTGLEPCNNEEECKQEVRDVQSKHFGFGWSDIGYNFLVGGDGCAYVGRGWDKAGAHAKLFNNRSIGISFIGNFKYALPPKKQIVTAKLILEEGIRLKKLAPNYKLLTHNQVSSTESPGAKLIENIQAWAHWSEYDPIKDSPPIQDNSKQLKIEEKT